MRQVRSHMMQTRHGLWAALLLLIGMALASPALAVECFVPLQWQQEVAPGVFKNATSSLDDANNPNYVDDAIDALDPNDPVDVLLELNRCAFQEDVARIESTIGHSIDRRFDFVGVISIKTITASVAQSLASDVIVAFVEFDHPVNTLLDISNPAIKVRTSGPYFPNTVEDQHPTIDGTGITIAIIDTGVDDGVHESIPGPKFVGGYNAFTDTEGNPDDDHGHGTHVAGIALGTGGGTSAYGGGSGTYQGIAPEADLVDIKVLDSSGSGTWSGVIAGIEKVIERRNDWGIDVMNLSLGGGPQSDGTDSVSVTVNRAVRAGIIAVVAAGNDGPGMSIKAPAAADDAVTVANSDDDGTVTRNDDTIANSSSRGPRLSDGDGGTLDELKPDLTAPGSTIHSADFDTLAVYVDKTGTSMAAPHVAGCAALIKQADPSITPLSAKKLLIDTAEDKGPLRWDKSWGWGLLDCFAAVDDLLTTPGTDLKFEVWFCKPGNNPKCWKSPDLTPANPVIVEGVPNAVQAVVTNMGPNPATNITVNLGVYNFSNGDDDYPLQSVTIAGPLAAGSTAVVSVPWVPTVSGTGGQVHACLKSEILYPFDTDFGNNRAQHNIDIQNVASPASFEVMVFNPTAEDLAVSLEDTLVAGDPNDWQVTFSENNFFMGGSDCPKTVTVELTMTGAPTGVWESAEVDIAISGEPNGPLLDLGGVTVIAVVPGPAGKDQQKCINSVNKGAAKIVKAQGKDICDCIKNGAKGKLTGSIEDCVTSDPKGKVAKAKSKYDDKTTKDCESGSAFLNLADAADVKQSAMDKDINLIHWIFGSDLDIAIVKQADDKAKAKCQIAVAKAAKKCQDTKLKVYNSCKKDELKGKNGPAVTSAQELQDRCLGTGTGSIPDPKGKLAKCNQKMLDTINKKCTPPYPLCFPGCPGATDALELKLCMDYMIECEVCRYLNAVDGLFRDCDLFDDGVSNGSCPP